ncbi:MAG: TetR-like C-terminal domain-containing protein [Coriobacteriales bacterium]
MYHIKKDARSKKSAEMFYQGLLKCLEKTPLDKVSVTDVQKASGAGRSTFYRNFDAVIDILKWKCDAQFSEAIDSYVEMLSNEHRKDLLLYMLSYWMQHSDVIEALLGAGRVDVVYRSFLDTHQMVEEHLARIGIMLSNDTQERYFSAVSAGFFISIMDAWIAGGKKESPKQVAAIVESQGRRIAEAAASTSPKG